MNVMNANGRGESIKQGCSRNGPSAQHLGFWFQFGADGGSATAGPTGTQNCCKHAVGVRVAVALGKQRNQKQHGIVTKLPQQITIRKCRRPTSYVCLNRNIQIFPEQN